MSRKLIRKPTYLPTIKVSVRSSDVVLKTGLGLKTGLKTIFFFEVLVLAKAVLVLVLTLDGFKDLKICGLKTAIFRRKCLKTFF